MKMLRKKELKILFQPLATTLMNDGRTNNVAGNTGKKPLTIHCHPTQCSHLFVFSTPAQIKVLNFLFSYLFSFIQQYYLLYNILLKNSCTVCRGSCIMPGTYSVLKTYTQKSSINRMMTIHISNKTILNRLHSQDRQDFNLNCKLQLLMPVGRQFRSVM